MKLLLAAVLTLFVLNGASGQKSPIKFGDIPMEDMKMKVYDKDSSAVAVILRNHETSLSDNQRTGLLHNPICRRS
jgi:hypothetical protein